MKNEWKLEICHLKNLVKKTKLDAIQTDAFTIRYKKYVSIWQNDW